MLNIDNWYNTPFEEIDGIDWSFYAGEGYRGNLYSHEKAVGDFTADEIGEIISYFPEIYNKSKQELFFDIWNNSYNTFAETDDAIMWDYLREQIKNGNITQEDAEAIAEDVIDTYNL